MRVNVVAHSAYQRDVCIYGGTASGVIAARAAADMGASVMLVEPGSHLGGMTSGGLGASDTGSADSITGLARGIAMNASGRNIGKTVSWTHEPGAVAEAVLNEMIGARNITILYGQRIQSLNPQAGEWIEEAIFESGADPALPVVEVSAGAVIDCSYEGDLMDRANMSYIVGHEVERRIRRTLQWHKALLDDAVWRRSLYESG